MCQCFWNDTFKSKIGKKLWKSDDLPVDTDLTSEQISDLSVDQQYLYLIVKAFKDNF